MELLHSKSCRACVARHVGPALESITDYGERMWCGGCGSTQDVVRFTYWFPWPDDDPYEGYDPRDDPNHPDFEKEIE